MAWEHGFYAGRIAIHKQQFEQIRELVVNDTGMLVISVQCHADHTAEFRRARHCLSTEITPTAPIVISG